MGGVLLAGPAYLGWGRGGLQGEGFGGVEEEEKLVLWGRLGRLDYGLWPGARARFVVWDLDSRGGVS